MSADDLAAMQRAALRPDGADALLAWLSRRIGGAAALVGPDGTPARPAPAFPGEVLAEAQADIRRVTAGDASSASVSGPSWWARVAGADGGQGGPALLVTSRRPLAEGDGSLITSTASLLYLRLAADEREAAVSQIREAVLYLLMAGQISPARRVAAAVKPDLARALRVFLVDGPPGARDAIAAACEAALGGQAWIIRCPVYRRHVIVLCPAEDGPALSDAVLAALRPAVPPGAAIGVGDVVQLHDAAAGYAQAYHALVVARHRPDRIARFTAAGDLAAVLGPGAVWWARRQLAPLTRYEPPRPQYPDAAELRGTLLSWLAFGPAAARHLKIHRNTLAKRVRMIGTLLGRDLTAVSDQADVHLALQLLHRPDGDGTALDRTASLTGLLASPSARSWASMTLAPLDGPEHRVLMATVRAWLDAGGSAEGAAAALAISPHAVRERLGRAEQQLGRSLLGGPTARHEVVLAIRILDAALRE